MRRSLASGNALNKLCRTADVLRREFRECGITLYAGSACFFLSLSALPAAALILGLFQLLPDPVAARLTASFSLLPEEVTALLSGLLSVGNPVAVISFSALTALWAASRGIFGILQGLNRAFCLHETRSWLRTRLSCMADMLLFLILIPAIVVMGNWATALVSKRLLQVALVLITVYFIYRALPDHAPGLLYLLPGAAFTAVSWLLFSRIYRFYLLKISPGRLTGGISNAAVTLLWMYFCIELLFFGAILCRLLSKRKNPQEK